MLSETDFHEWWGDRNYPGGEGQFRNAVWQYFEAHIRQSFPQEAVEDLVSEFYTVVDKAARKDKILINDPCVDFVIDMGRLWNGERRLQ